MNHLRLQLRHLAALTCLLTFASLASAQGPGDLNLSFNSDDPGFNRGVGIGSGSINSIGVQSDGKIIIGGSFTSFNNKNPANHFLRLTSDGDIDPSFQGTGFPVQVEHIFVQPDNKILVAGSFTSYSGTLVNGRHIRLLSDGTRDVTYNPVASPNGTVLSAISQADGKVIVIGEFTSYNGSPVGRILRFNADGTIDNTFTPGTGADHTIHTVAMQNDGKILIGGNFQNYNGSARARIARLNTDGTLDSGFDPGTGASGIVHAIAIQGDNKIIVAGQFLAFNGINVNRIVRLNANGTRDLGYATGSGFSGAIVGLAINADGKTIAIGAQTTFNGSPSKSISRLNVDGTLDVTFSAGNGVEGGIMAIAQDSNDQILISGGFTSYDGLHSGGIARLEQNGLIDHTFNPLTGTHDPVNEFELQPDGKILVAGDFITFNKVRAGRITRLNADGTIDGAFNTGAGADNRISAVHRLSDGNILVGGDFTEVDGTPANRLAKLSSTGSPDPSFPAAAGLTSTGFITDLGILSTNKIVITGNLGMYDGASINTSIARLHANGTLDNTFTVIVSPSTIQQVIVLPDDKLLICGSFTTINGESRNRIARLNADGSLDFTFQINGGANGTIRTMAVQPDGKVLIGGALTSFNGAPAHELARLNPDGTLDESFSSGASGFNGSPYRIIVAPDGQIIVAGIFSNYNGTTVSSVVRLSSTGTLDTQFNTGATSMGVTRDAVVAGDQLVIGGDFTSYKGIGRNRIASIFLQQQPEPPKPFITTWKSDNPGGSAANQVIIPTNGTGYDYNIYWEKVDAPAVNGTSIDQTGNATVTFPSPGVYRVEISGDFPRIHFDGHADKEKILTVEQWGDIEWTSMANAFAGCSNLTIPAVDAPDLSNVKDLTRMLSGCTSFNQPVNHWDVSTITNMQNLFASATSFNQELNNWDVSNVQYMSRMFSKAESFNRDLNQWQVGNVILMEGMFIDALNFNGDISGWDVSNVTNTARMFTRSYKFNRDIGNWNVGNVTDMASMFHAAIVFNHAIGNWDVSNVTSMDYMFNYAGSFNQDLGNWNVSSVTTMVEMIASCGISPANYDATLNGWAAQLLKSNVQLGAQGRIYCYSTPARNKLIDTFSWTITGDLRTCPAAFITTWKTDNPGSSAANQITIPTTGAGYNYTIYWEKLDAPGINGLLAAQTGNATITFPTPGTYRVGILGIFPRIYFNGVGDADKILTIEQWGSGAWSSMERAFAQCSNLTLTATDVPNLSNVTNMEGMFSGATTFNQPVDHWDVSHVTDMSHLFSGASAFDHNLSNWNISLVTNMSGIFDNSGLSTTNYDNILAGWSTQDVQAGVAFGAAGRSYCGAIESRNALTSAPNNWIFTGDLPCVQIEAKVDSLALVALYHATNGAAWTNRTNWLTGTLDTWYGVKVANGRVTEVNLMSNNLAGEIPEEIGDIAQLQSLWIGVNGLTGEIPASIGKLSHLKSLSLIATQITGSIPIEIGHLTNLEFVDLGINKLTGTVPKEIAFLPLLHSFRVPGNQLTGDIPAEFGNMAAIQTLELGGNMFTGLADFSDIASLNTLYVADNKLTFEDITKNLDVQGFTYAPQKNLPALPGVALQTGNVLNLSYNESAVDNQFQWYKDEMPIAGATTNSYTKVFSADDEGSYHLQITNTRAPLLTLRSDPTIVSRTTSPLETDSLALVAFYHATDGPNWTNNTNWLSENISSWYGITVTDGRVTAIDLPDNNLSKKVPSAITALTALAAIDLSGNALTFLPNLTSITGITQLNISRNRLVFSSLVPNAGITGINYADQAEIGEPLNEVIAAGSTVKLGVRDAGEGSVYEWKRNGDVISDAVDSIYTITSLARATMGTYAVVATHPDLPGSTLRSPDMTVVASAKLSGHLLKSPGIAITKGEVRLLQVREESYDTAYVEPVNGDGEFSFNNIILDDYIVLAVADPVLYSDLLPTYNDDHFLWQDAPVLALDADLVVDAITMRSRPAALSGTGEISGVFRNATNSGGRTKEVSVNDIPVALLVVNNGVRSLAGYTMTNSAGEFTFSAVPQGSYLVNIQHPGYDMATGASQNINVGTGVAGKIFVDATFGDNVITLAQKIITGLDESSADLRVFPNPASGQFNITSYAKGKTLAFDLVSSIGQVVLHDSVHQGTGTVNVSHLPPGLYYIRSYLEDGRIRTTPVVIR